MIDPRDPRMAAMLAQAEAAPPEMGMGMEAPPMGPEMAGMPPGMPPEAADPEMGMDPAMAGGAPPDPSAQFPSLDPGQMAMMIQQIMRQMHDGEHQLLDQYQAAARAMAAQVLAEEMAGAGPSTLDGQAALAPGL